MLFYILPWLNYYLVITNEKSKKEILVLITRACGGCWLTLLRRMVCSLPGGELTGIIPPKVWVAWGKLWGFSSHLHVPSSVVILTKWEYYLNLVLYFAGVFDMFKKCKTISSGGICLHLALIHTLGGSEYSGALFCVF